MPAAFDAAEPFPPPRAERGGQCPPYELEAGGGSGDAEAL
jgi:hypothetical protein